MESLVFEDGVTDMAIKAVDKTSGGYTVSIENKSVKPLPIDLTLTFEDGTKEKITVLLAYGKKVIDW